MRPDLSIVVPIYNEVENLLPLHASICDGLAGTDYRFEILLVDDGSTDGSREQLRDLAQRDSRLRVVFLRRNFGQTVAMQSGIQRAEGRIIVTMDGDLQNDPHDIPMLVQAIDNGADLVAGWRKNRQDRMLSRKIPSRIANWMIRKFLGLPVHDLGCTLRAYRAELIQQIPLYSDMHRYIAAMCTIATDRIIEVEVSHHPRRFGQSKYGLSRTWRVVIDAITLKMLLSSAQRPLYWFGFWSLGVFLLAGVAAAFSFVQYRMSEADPSLVWPGITFLLAYLGGHLLFAGIFADLVLRAEPGQRITPLYDVE